MRTHLHLKYLRFEQADQSVRFHKTVPHRKLNNPIFRSLLDEIPQLGETRRAALLDRFGSVTAMRKASAEDLAATPGIGATIAAIIYDHLQSLSIPAVDMNTGEILDS